MSFPACARAAPVLVMGPHGQVRWRTDRFLPPAPAGPGLPPGRLGSGPPPVASAPRESARVAAAASATPAGRRFGRRSVPVLLRALARLRRAGELTAAAYAADRASFLAACRELSRLGGVRRAELGAVIDNLQQIAAAGQLTPSRLPALFLTLERNRQWWSRGPLLATWQRVEFSGSQLVWEYYPAQGLELQVLGSFAKANGLYSAGRSAYPQLRALLGELIPLAARRADGLAWEYYFQFDGGQPPWVSAMAQGTALQALARAASALGPAPYLTVAQQALALFTVAPPAGVRVATPLGARYLQYSFAPGTDIINAFLQSLIGLQQYAQATGNPEAQRLFAAGNAQAQAELPRFDTGAWSLYQPGVEDSLSYHLLVTGFLQQLCASVGAPVYCTTAQHFERYLHTPPVLSALTVRATARRAFRLRFMLSKYSGVTLLVRGAHRRFTAGASFPYGTDAFQIPALSAGAYTVTLRATDLAGNTAQIASPLSVRPPPAVRRAGPQAT